jgi:hypothetical protein
MKKIAEFLNILDAAGKLSVTNTAVYVVLVKLALVANPGIAETGALLIAIANYGHKRYTNAASSESEVDVESQVADATASLTEQVTELSNQVSSLAVKVNLK